MDAAVLLEDISQDYLLLSGLIDGVGFHEHKQLSRLLCHVLHCVMGDANCTCSRGRGEFHNAILASNVLATLLAMERTKALRLQSNLSTFMRGNSVVPLLFDAIGRQWLQPTMSAAMEATMRALTKGDTATAVDDLLDLDLVHDGVDVDCALERFAVLVNDLWDVVVGSVPRWPLPLRWALASIGRASGDAEGIIRENLVPMLSTVVVLRVVIPCVMGAVHRAHDEDEFSETNIQQQKRVMLLTKVLQRAAYHTDTDLPAEDGGATTLTTTSSAVAPIVEHLHQRIVGLWWNLLDEASIMDTLKRCDTAVHHSRLSNRGTTTPLTGSPTRLEGAHCVAVLELLAFVDLHTTAIIAHMHAAAPMLAPIHLHRLHNFSRFVSRRIDQSPPTEIAEADAASASNSSASSPLQPSQRPKATSQIAAAASSSFQALRNKFSRSRSSSQTLATPPVVVVTAAPEPSKEEIFEELVRHSSRCRLQPETLNYAQLYCLLLGNVPTVCSAKEKQDAESASFLGPSPSGEVEPGRVGCAFLALYADQLTEGNKQFNVERERNNSVLQKHIPLAVRHCQRLAPSVLSDGALDAAAHLCFMLDVVVQSSGSSTSVQLLCFPPQEPLKCGCGKEWLRAIVHHLLPPRVVALISQIIFAQPSAPGGGGNNIFRSLGFTPSGRFVAATTTQQIFAHDTPVALPWNGPGGTEKRVLGVKTHSVLSAVEHLMIGGTAELDDSVLPSALVSSQLPPTHKPVRIPLTFRDYHLLKLEAAEQSTATPLTRSRRNSFSKGAASSRSVGADERSLFPDELPSPPPGIKSPVFDRNSPQAPDATTPSDSSVRGPLLLREHASDVWEPRLQRHVLELVWSVAALPHRHQNVTAVGIPRSVLKPFRTKVCEWFCGFHIDLVENLVSSSASAAAQRLTSDRLRRDPVVPPSTSSLLRRNPSFHGASPPPRPAPRPGGGGKALLPHCTWLGFLSDRMNPLDMAEFEAACYQTITEVYGTRSGVDAATGDSSSWLFVESGGEPQRNSQVHLCSVSLQHLTLRSLWRMLLYSVARTWGTIASFELWDSWCIAVAGLAKDVHASSEAQGVEAELFQQSVPPPSVYLKSVARSIVEVTRQYGDCEHEMLVLLIQCFMFVRDVSEDASDATLGRGIAQILSAFAPNCGDNTIEVASETGSTTTAKTIDVVSRALAEFGHVVLSELSLCSRGVAPITSRSWLSGFPRELLEAQVPLLP